MARIRRPNFPVTSPTSLIPTPADLRASGMKPGTITTKQAVLQASYGKGSGGPSKSIGDITDLVLYDINTVGTDETVRFDWTLPANATDYLVEKTLIADTAQVELVPWVEFTGGAPFNSEFTLDQTWDDYTYRIRGVNETLGLMGEWSNVADVEITRPVGVVNDLAFSADSNTITYTYSTPANATKVYWQYKDHGTVDWTDGGEFPYTSGTPFPALNAFDFDVQIRGWNIGSGFGDWSNQIEAVFVGAPPAQPGDITDLRASTNGSFAGFPIIVLDFTPPADATSYEWMWRVTGDAWPADAMADSGTYPDFTWPVDLDSANEYDFRMRPLNTIGAQTTYGDWSNIATLTHPVAPAAITDLTATVAPGGDATAIQLAYTLPANANYVEYQYRVLGAAWPSTAQGNSDDNPDKILHGVDSALDHEFRAIAYNRAVNGSTNIGESASPWSNVPVLTMTAFTYDIDFVAGTSKTVAQPYGSNTIDGRPFRDPNNVTPTWIPNAAGILVPIGNSGLRRSTAGHFQYPSYGSCRNLQARNFTTTWAATGITSARSTGADGVVNSGSRLTATSANGKITQLYTIASSTVLIQADIKRVSGTGRIWLTCDDGVTLTEVTPGAGAFALVVATQAALANPVVGIVMETSGDVIDVDFFNTYINPPNSILLPSQYRIATTTATILGSQSRPNAAVADGSPLITVAQGAFAFFWQGRSQRDIGNAFVITGATGIFINSTATGAVKFNDGPGQSQTRDGVWRTGLDKLNKVAGYVTATGQIKVACNGILGNLDTDATLESALDHFDLGTNGAGANSIYGISERFSITPNLVLSDDQLIAMTTWADAPTELPGPIGALSVTKLTGDRVQMNFATTYNAVRYEWMWRAVGDAWPGVAQADSDTYPDFISPLVMNPALTYEFRARPVNDGPTGIVYGAWSNIATAAGTPSTYLGPVATQAGMPTALSTGNKQANSRTYHVTTEAVTALVVELPNWYWPRSSSGPEAGSGGVITYECAIEYPEGTFTRCLFGGANSFALPNNTAKQTDSTAVAIPANTGFWVRTWAVAATAIVFTDGNASPPTWSVDFAHGEGYEYAASGMSSKVMGGTIGHNLGVVPQASILRPTAILGMTNKGTVGILGDSRDWGFGDAFDGDGGKGDIARSLSALHIGHVNMGSSGDTYSAFITSHAKRAAVLNYCSHIVIGDAINGLRSGGSGQNKSAATVLGEVATLMSYFPGKTIITTTTGGPNPTSSNNFADAAGQTVNPNHAQIVAYNDAIRAGVAGSSGYLEIADQVESARNSGKWWTTGVANATTWDGLHCTPAGYQRIRDSGAISAPLFVRL